MPPTMSKYAKVISKPTSKPTEHASMDRNIVFTSLVLMVGAAASTATAIKLTYFVRFFMDRFGVTTPVGGVFLSRAPSGQALIGRNSPSQLDFRTDSAAHEHTLRAPGDIARCFASEGFMDEIAADLKVDPVDFRMQHLTANKRGAECLKAAVDKAGWQKRPSPAPASSGNIARGRGVAMTQRANTYIAIVAEVDVDKSSGLSGREAYRLLPRLRPDDQPRRRHESSGRQHYSRCEPGDVRRG